MLAVGAGLLWAGVGVPSVGGGVRLGVGAAVGACDVLADAGVVRCTCGVRGGFLGALVGAAWCGAAVAGAVPNPSAWAGGGVGAKIAWMNIPVVISPTGMAAAVAVNARRALGARKSTMKSLR